MVNMTESDQAAAAVLVRLPPETLQRLDDYVRTRNATGNGARISRNGAVRFLLERALEQLPETATTKSPVKKAAGRR
jgi:hypothetical protein